MKDSLEKKILATIIYYDGLDYPLTLFEVWRYLLRTDYYAHGEETLQINLADISNILQSSNLSKYISQENGFYFLKDRNYLVRRRIINNKISVKKLKKLQWVVWWLRCIPFVRMIGVTGALAMKNAKARSDWDLLIVLKAGKIWTGRTLVTLAMHFLKKRRHGSKIADRVCLNFFVTENSLEIIIKDLFSASEYMFMRPMFGWESFLKFQMKNQWIKTMKPLYHLSSMQPLKFFAETFWSRNLKKTGEIILAPVAIEKWLKQMEKKRIMKNPKTHQEGSLVYANDDALVFLPEPHGPKLFEAFKEKIQQLGS